MSYYIFSRWVAPLDSDPDTKHWEFVEAKPNQEEADAYVSRHSESEELEFRVVSANTQWEARANLQLGLTEG